MSGSVGELISSQQKQIKEQAEMVSALHAQLNDTDKANKYLQDVVQELKKVNKSMQEKVQTHCHTHEVQHVNNANEIKKLRDENSMLRQEMTAGEALAKMNARLVNENKMLQSAVTEKSQEIARISAAFVAFQEVKEDKDQRLTGEEIRILGSTWTSSDSARIGIIAALVGVKQPSTYRNEDIFALLLSITDPAKVKQAKELAASIAAKK
jgi:uncharacterized phage infection (PIP) family protein YhgE